MVGVRVVGGHSCGWGLVAAHGHSLSMGGAPLSVVEAWLWWAGCHCPWGGFSRCLCVLVMRGDIVTFGRLSFVGGRSSLFVEGASLWWAGGRCAWGCRRRPSALWAGVRGVEKAIVDVAHPDGCATSAAWWWASLSFLVIPGLLGIRRGECRCRCGTPRWVCHISRLVVGVVVGVCIVDDVDDVGVGLTWRCGGHDGGVGWWRLTTSGGRRGMVVVERRNVWHGLCQRFPIWQVPKRS